MTHKVYPEKSCVKIFTKGKRGVSTVVATVFVVLLAVFAVAILFTFVLPSVDDNLQSVVQEQVELSISTSGGYTIWDETNKLAKVQIKRGNDNANLEGINFKFYKEDGSLDHTSTEVPSQGQVKTYSFILGDFGKPEGIKITANIRLDNGDVVEEVIPTGQTEIGNFFTSGGIDEGNSDDGDLTNPTYDFNYIEISTCQTLNTTGGKYRLTQDITTTGTCFTIGANNILLDLNGMRITGDDGIGDRGVYSNGYDGAVIENGEVYNMWKGIYMDISSNNTFTNLNLSSNGDDGIHLDTSSNNTFTNLNLSSNGDTGLFLYLSHNNNMATITANLNEGGGIFFDSSNYNILTDAITNSNGIYAEGVFLSSSNYNSLTGVVANSNSYDGIYLDFADYNNLTNINASDNEDYGVWLTFSQNNLLTNINASLNNDHGIEIEDSNNNQIISSYACNANPGYFDLHFSGTNIGCTGTGNTWTNVSGACSGWPVLDTHYTNC